MSPPDLVRWLVARVSERTWLRPEEVDVDLPLQELGVSSIAAAEIAADLTRLLGTEVHPALVFEYPTIRALADSIGGTGPARVPQPDRGTESGPIAIVGMSVRVPGACSADKFWELLRRGDDPVSEVPAARWQLDAQSVTEAERGARFAGLLADVASFDAEFFRIPREEALRMDPQQRLLLQGAWEALEDAGQVPARLAGGRTGVYVGITNNDYVRRQLGSPDDVHALTPTGNAMSIAANRVSYLLDLRGPSLAVDTACSSSLVAVHLAVRDLRRGDCELAVAAGVNLLLEPDASLALARAGMLAPDGRCKPFDAAANGYVRGEGCVAVILKRLDHALRDGDRVYAVVLGTEVNQDGRSNGLTAPNPAAQEAVLRGAYADARVDPHAVQYVECHGTGTLLGDPIEARALGTVIGAGRPGGQPCLIGSVKSNVGHLESAAGVAGLVKVALSLHHGRLPRTLHFRTGNPHIDFAALGLRVTGSECDWPGPADERLAGVSSFGFGGTNVHVVLAGPAQYCPPAGESGPGAARAPFVLPVSARHPDALIAGAHALAARLDELAASGEPDLPAVAAAVSVRRTHHPWRYAAVGSTARELAGQLRDVRRSGLAEPHPRRRLVFAFPGQTEHATATLLSLADASPLAAATLRRCDEVIEEEEAGWSLLEVLRRPDADQVLREDTGMAQAASVAAQLVLASAWQGVGIQPAEVIGHSLGEVSAAVVAGALTLQQGIQVSLARGAVISKVIGTGRMLAMAVSPQEAEQIAGAAWDRMAVATINGPAAVVLSGEADALEQVRKAAESGGVLARWVPVDYPSHSPWMTDSADELTVVLGDLAPADPQLRFWSSAQGGELDGPLDASYWGGNLRYPVRFADAAGGMLAADPVIVVELSTHPVLRAPLTQLAGSSAGADLTYIATVERDAEPVRHFRAGIARLYEVGVDPAWRGLAPPARYVPVPTYPWRQQRYWLPRATVVAGRRPGDHPLLGRKLDLARPGGRRREHWELRLPGEPPPVTAGHAVGGRAVLSGAGYLEMALAAGRRLGIEGPIEVRDARFTAFLPLSEGPLVVQTVAEEREGRGYGITIMSRAADGDWLVNATAAVTPSDGPADPAPIMDPATARSTCFHPISRPVFYASLEAVGLTYSGDYRALDDIWSGAGAAVATVSSPADTGRYVLDPRILDGALQLTAAASPVAPDARPVVLGIRRLIVAAPASGSLSVVAKAARPGDGHATASVAIFAGESLVVSVEGMQASTATAATAPARSVLHFYEPVWRLQDVPAAPRRALSDSSWIVMSAPGMPIRDAIVARLRAAGAEVRAADPGDAERGLTPVGAREPAAGAVDVVYLADAAAEPDAEPDAGQVTAETIALVSLIKAAAASDLEVRRLWVITSGSQDVRDAPQAIRPGAGALWGLVKVLPFEIPNLRAVCVDLDTDPRGEPVARLIEEFSRPGTETEIALRGPRRYVARLAAVEAPGRGENDSPVRAGASYLITGGLGAIGLRMARWLCEQGAGAIGLLGRRPPGAGARQVIDELERAGTKIVISCGDVAEGRTSADAAAALRRLGPIRGVAHAAGTIDDGPLLNLPDAAAESVLRPKVSGALCLSEATREDGLDWVVYFSSAASVLGSPGQANYCAANAFLDSYGAAQRVSGRPAIVVNWGPWADAGLAAGTPGAEGHLAAAYAALDPGDGIETLAAVLRADRPRTIVLASDLRHLVRLFPAAAGTARFSELAPAGDIVLHDIGLGSPGATRPALQQPYTAPRNDLERRIVGIWQRSLGFNRIGVHDSFFELGGDSVFANQMLLEVNKMMGVAITAEVAFDGLTAARLAELAEQEMVARLAVMSDEEAERLLQQEDGG